MNENESDNDTILEPELQYETPMTWKEALTNHFLLFAQFFLPRKVFNETEEFVSKKQVILALLNMIGISLFISLPLQATADGPDILSQYYQGNFRVYSQFLKGFGYLSFLFIFIILILVGFLTPFILNTIFLQPQFKKLKNNSNQKRVHWRKIIISSSYSVLPLLFYFALIYSIMILIYWNSLSMVFIEDGFFNILLILFALSLLFSIGGMMSLSIKLLNLSKKTVLIEGFAMVLLIVAILLIILL